MKCQEYLKPNLKRNQVRDLREKPKETSGNTASLEREEPKESDFKPEGELETGYTEESWAKPEKDMEEKESVKI